VTATVDRNGLVLARLLDDATDELARIDVTTDPPTKVETIGCPVPTGRCEAVNWVPRTVRPIYSTSEGYVVAGDTPMIHPLHLQRLERSRKRVKSPPTPVDVHTLWASDDERRILAVTPERVMLWTVSGELAWEWESPGSTHGAAFAPDGSVLVAVGLEVFRVRAGRAKRLAAVPPRRFASTDLAAEFLATHRLFHFIDQLLPLPGGGFAYSLAETYAPRDRG
jgi:hypothetical protein